MFYYDVYSAVGRMKCVHCEFLPTTDMLHLCVSYVPQTQLKTSRAQGKKHQVLSTQTHLEMSGFPINYHQPQTGTVLWNPSKHRLEQQSLALLHHHPLHLPMWKSGHKHTMWMWYDRVMTDDRFALKLMSTVESWWLGWAKRFGIWSYSSCSLVAWPHAPGEMSGVTLRTTRRDTIEKVTAQMNCDWIQPINMQSSLHAVLSRPTLQILFYFHISPQMCFL